MSPAFVNISSTSCILARATSLAANSQAMAWSWSRLALSPPSFSPRAACVRPSGVNPGTSLLNVMSMVAS
eukprot:4174183-Lingulodinium_polyedra.AAC.1